VKRYPLRCDQASLHREKNHPDAVDDGMEMNENGKRRQPGVGAQIVGSRKTHKDRGDSQKCIRGEKPSIDGPNILESIR
jgi:hypothetical protein